MGISKLSEALDKADRERTNFVKDSPPYGIKKHDLQKLFLGDTISRMISRSKPVLFNGPTAKNPADIIPFLYFYNSVALEICPHCPQTRNTKALEPFLDRGFLSIYVTGSFSQTTDEFQKLALRYPDLIVGHESYHGYLYYALNPKDPSKTSSKEHYCVQCISERIRPYLDNLSRMDPQKKDIMNRTYSGIVGGIMTPLAHNYADLFIEIIKNPNIDRMVKLRSMVSLSCFLSSANALEAFPQINNDYIYNSKILTQSLRILHPEETDLDLYLDLASKYRNKLSPNSIGSSPEEIIKKAREINEEIEKIDTSKRKRFSEFLSKLDNLPDVLAKVICGGRYDFDGGLKISKMITNSEYGMKIEGKLLSKYYQVSEDSIKVWQIRRYAKQLKK